MNIKMVVNMAYMQYHLTAPKVGASFLNQHTMHNERPVKISGANYVPNENEGVGHYNPYAIIP